MTEQLLSTLTAQDIRALRSADSITFRHHKGQGAIEANRDGRNTADGFDQKHYVWVDAGFIDYEPDPYDARLTSDTALCFEMINSAQYSRVWESVVRRLGTGDTIRLTWAANNNNDLVREAGLHVDQLGIEISKKGNPDKREFYLLDVSVCRNNTARMIRRDK